MLDKVFLFIFGVEWFGFGVLGLFFPEIISNMIGINEKLKSPKKLDVSKKYYIFHRFSNFKLK